MCRNILWSTVILIACNSYSPASPFFASTDFNWDEVSNAPGGETFLFGGAAHWEATGGVDDSGYLSITDAKNSERGIAVFERITGEFIQGFDISVDVRIGGGSEQPVGGFSINLSRAYDPAIQHFFGAIEDGISQTNDAVAGFASFDSLGDETEEGTTTGIAFGFDEWPSSASDVTGMSIRIDNELLAQIELPTLNGSVGDPTSLQTGPRGDGAEGLGWAKFSSRLDPLTGNLTVTWKDSVVFDEFIGPKQFPEAALSFAGSTGDFNSAHHIDNLAFSELEIPQFALPGDTNLDGVVDFADFLTLSSNFGMAGAWVHGDFDRSGDVQFIDYLFLARNFGKSVNGVAAVPEPNGVMLFLLALVVVRAVTLLSNPRRIGEVPFHAGVRN